MTPLCVRPPSAVVQRGAVAAAVVLKYGGCRRCGAYGGVVVAEHAVAFLVNCLVTPSEAAQASRVEPPPVLLLLWPPPLPQELLWSKGKR